MKIAASILFFALSTGIVHAQVTVRNQLEFTHWDEENRDILENWTDVSVQRDQYQIGLRYEINHPPDPYIYPQDDLLKEYDLTYGYAEFSHGVLTFTAGDYYTMFGRGMVLRTYEDRNLRVDNNLRGARLRISGSRYQVTGIAGKMRDKYNRREDAVYGVDGELDLLESLKIGGSYLQHDDKNRLWSSRLNLYHALGDMVLEVAKPQWTDQLSSYFAMNAAAGQFALTFEYKDYNRLSFRNSLGTEYNAAPSLSREHSYTLLNRHPHALNMDDEKGYQIELNYYPGLTWEFTLNHSETVNHSGVRLFREYYGEVHHYVNDDLDVRSAVAWTFDLTTNTNSITPLIDILYTLSEREQLHLSYQHQHITNRFDSSEYDDDLLLIEYSRSPWYSIAFVGEYTNQDQLKHIKLDRNYWIYGNLTLYIGTNHQIELLYGSRQAGFVCVGGICRYEPEFEGLEIKLVNRF